jgi:D-alanyl-D-alanine carboxypeptidase
MKNLIILFLVFSCSALFATEIENSCGKGNAFLVFEESSGKVLLQQDAEKVIYPASLTKLMTAYLVFEAINNKKLNWKKKIKISRNAELVSRMNKVNTLNLTTKNKMTVLQATQAMLVRSYNEAAVALAEAVAGNQQNFAKLMNQKAQKLGMNNTNFVNASGLHDDNQYSTAYDLSKLAIAIKKNFPQFYHFFSLKQFSFRGKKYFSHSDFLLSYDGAEGMKTGYTIASGFNLIATAKRDNNRLFGVLIGCDNNKKRTELMSMLFDIGFYDVNNFAVN